MPKRKRKVEIKDRDIYFAMLDNALEYCMDKCRLCKSSDVIERMKSGDATINGYFRYGLSMEIARYIKRNIPCVRGIYLYGSTLTDEFYQSSDIGAMLTDKCRITSDINIIVHLSKCRHFDRILIDNLNNHLTKCYCEIVGLMFSSRFSVLDAHLVDDKDVKQRKGLAALIRSVFTPPIKL